MQQPKRASRRHFYFVMAILLLLAWFTYVHRERRHFLSSWPTSWPNGTNYCFDIEVEEGKGSTVLIPDVKSVETTWRFILGRADWKYIGGRWMSRNTNEFWFVLDKYRASPKCYLLVSTNEGKWVSWCGQHGVSTNLLEVSQFDAQTSSHQTGDGSL